MSIVEEEMPMDIDENASDEEESNEAIPEDQMFDDEDEGGNFDPMSIEWRNEPIDQRRALDNGFIPELH